VGRAVGVAVLSRLVRLQDLSNLNAIPAAVVEPPWFESAANLLLEPDPGPTPFLVEDLCTEAALASMVGQWKVRKTWALAELAIAIATGEKAFGRFTVPKPGPVLLVVEESGREALHRRLDMLVRGRALEPGRLGEFYFAANRRVRLDQDEWRDRLLETARSRAWRLIAFDPFARVKGYVNENDQHEVGPLLDFLRELRDERRRGALCPPHPARRIAATGLIGLRGVLGVEAHSPCLGREADARSRAPRSRGRRALRALLPLPRRDSHPANRRRRGRAGAERPRVPGGASGRVCQRRRWRG
jgi:AAA domain-containing protein